MFSQKLKRIHRTCGFLERHSLDVVAVHEHDVVPVGPIHVQVDLSDVGGESSGSGLQFLKMIQETGEENIKIAPKASRCRSNLVKVLLLLLDFGNVKQETPHLPP